MDHSWMQKIQRTRDSTTGKSMKITTGGRAFFTLQRRSTRLISTQHPSTATNPVEWRRVRCPRNVCVTKKTTTMMPHHIPISRKGTIGCGPSYAPFSSFSWVLFREPWPWRRIKIWELPNMWQPLTPMSLQPNLALPSKIPLTKARGRRPMNPATKIPTLCFRISRSMHLPWHPSSNRAQKQPTWPRRLLPCTTNGRSPS
mmetsp:Transcript_14856/g.31467  ORF Transcript_14856/g.31467 Transcript_14856/m.31467 type:complete len:200 (+) Transcript_14856:271-870(+)